MARFTDKEYAEYMLANYTLGYIDTAIFIAANLFEKYFQTMVSKHEAKNELRISEKYITLKHYITSYVKYKSHQDVIYSQGNDLIAKLDSFRKLRNDLIHEMNDDKIIQNKRQIGEFILYIYYSFHKNLNYDSSIIHDESINNTLIQDYKIKEITERMIARMEKEKITAQSNLVKTFQGINKNDFDNLFELRKKLRYLQRVIENDISDIGLKSTILSPIDTTSAYIWMPFVDKEFTDNVNSFQTKRNNLLIGSTSILATPVDFRIYIDFGGGDYEYRLAFQDFLQSEQFMTYIQRFKNHETPLKIFDIKWYSFIVKENNLLDVITDKSINDMALQAKTIIEKEKQQGKILTSGYNKIGFILQARDIGKIEILSLFKKVAHFYYEFLIYKFKDDPDIDILQSAQSKLEEQ